MGFLKFLWGHKIFRVLVYFNLFLNILSFIEESNYSIIQQERTAQITICSQAKISAQSEAKDLFQNLFNLSAGSTNTKRSLSFSRINSKLAQEKLIYIATNCGLSYGLENYLENTLQRGPPA